MKKEKLNLVIFDGSNFYHGSKHLMPRVSLTYFNYSKLVEIITKGRNNKIEYCVGEIKRDRHNSKSQKLYANQQTLFYQLDKQGIEIKKGYMLHHRHFTYQEKGVDVRIALDIQRGALKDEYDQCYIISSDTDIIPAILDAKEVGKEIIYVGFDGSLSRALKANCSKTIILTKELISGCARKRKVVLLEK